MAISRRGFLRGSALATGAVGMLSARQSLASAYGAGHWSQDLPSHDPMVHLLNRSSFGITDAMAKELPASVDEWLDEQLSPETLDDSELEMFLKRTYPGYYMPWEEQYVYYRRMHWSTDWKKMLTGADARTVVGAVLANPVDDMSLIFDAGKAIKELQGVTFYRQLQSPCQLFEVMVDFWTNHFNIYYYTSTNTVRYKALDDRDVIRPHALGRFGDLLRASATSPAMIAYLDGEENHKDHPNENYARELLELHTFGIEHYHSGSGSAPRGFYTEEDIRQIALCFTGWHTDSGRMGFNPNHHDTSNKWVLGHEIVGRDGDEGVDEALEVLQLLASHPSTARHVALRLAQRFISDNPAPDAVTEIAEAYLQSGGDIRHILRTLFHSSAFSAARDEKFVRPLEHLIKTLRTLGAEVTTEPTTHWDQPFIRPPNPYRQFLNHYLKKDGHVLFGWHTPDGYPLEAAYWANPNAALQRWRMISKLVENRDWDHWVTVDLEPLATGANTVAEVVDALALAVARRPLLEEDRQTLIDFAGAGASPDSVLEGSERAVALRGLVSLLIDSPYFQLQ